MRIEVLQSDIDHGERHCCERCPVARAITRAIGNRVAVAVYADRGAELGITSGGYTRWISLPDEVIEFINRFDIGLKVAPFTFELAYEPEVAAV